MGVLYYLAREDNRTLFEIGKLSLISDLFSELGEGNARRWEWLPRAVPPEPDLRQLIRIAIDEYAFSVDKDDYAIELARRIVVFADGQWVCLLNDASSDEEMDRLYSDDGELRVVDSVYTSEWGEWASQHPAHPAERH